MFEHRTMVWVNYLCGYSHFPGSAPALNISGAAPTRMTIRDIISDHNGSKRVFRSNFHGWKFVYIEKWTLPQKNCKNITPNRKLSKSNVKYCSQSKFTCSLAVHHRFSASKTSLKVGDNAINSEKNVRKSQFLWCKCRKTQSNHVSYGQTHQSYFPDAHIDSQYP